MSIFKKIFTNLSPPTSSDTRSSRVYVRCNRCDETICARINLSNDLSIKYDNGGTKYFCRKTIIGEGHCFQRIEVELTFGKNRNVIHREIQGGQFISKKEYLVDHPSI